MQRGVLRIGLWSALIAFVAGAGYSVVQVLQVLRILVWPTDAILIYAFSFCIAWPFLLQNVCALELVLRGPATTGDRGTILTVRNYEFRTCGPRSFDQANNEAGGRSVMA